MGHKRALINKRKRQKILERDNFTCQECGISGDFASLEVDHITPVCQGGNNEYSNLQSLCYKCNMEKRWRKNKGGKVVVENFSPRDKLKKIRDKINEYIDLSWAEFKVLFTQEDFFRYFRLNLGDVYDLFIELGGKKRVIGDSKQQRWKEQRNIAIKLLRDEGHTYKIISEKLKDGGNRMGITQIGDICKSFNKNKAPNDEKSDDLDEKEPNSDDLS